MRKPFKAWLGRASDHWMYLFAIAMSGFILYHLVVIWQHGGILIYEANKPVLIAEIVIFSIIAIFAAIRQIWVLKDLRSPKYWDKWDKEVEV